MRHAQDRLREAAARRAPRAARRRMGTRCAGQVRTRKRATTVVRFSPDGKFLAIAGENQVPPLSVFLLCEAITTAFKRVFLSYETMAFVANRLGPKPSSHMRARPLH
jgi:hypothetical protein